MAGTLTVWKFPTEHGAQDAIETLVGLQKRQLISVHDGAIVSWAADAKKPKTRQLHDLTAAGALGGAFWGLLFGMLFFVPLLGFAAGAGIGALSGSLTHVGIDEDFVDSVREKITPGSSALFVLTSDAALDRVHDEFRGRDAELLSTNLSHEQEARLREVFAD